MTDLLKAVLHAGLVVEAETHDECNHLRHDIHTLLAFQLQENRDAVVLKSIH